MDAQQPRTDRDTSPLTDRTVATLKAVDGKRLARPDGIVPGLSIRVTPKGRKTWALTYRIGRRQRRWTIGRYPTVGLKAARKKAQLALTQLDAGGDPAERKRESRRDPTFEDLASAYLKHARLKKRSWAQDDLTMRSVLLPMWRHKLVKDIKRRDVRELLDGIVARRKLVMANRVQALISTAFNFALREEWIETGNPAALIQKQPEVSRERVLADEELSVLWAALERSMTLSSGAEGRAAPAIAPMVARGLQVLLLTAQRSGEVFRMRWEDLDLVTGWEDEAGKSGWWTIPASASKNKQAHRVFLVPRVVDLIRQAKACGPSENRWVFGGEKGGSVAARASKAIRALRRSGEIDFDVHRHDLRRTAATAMGRAGVQRAHIAHVLNHVDRGARATQVYDRYDHDLEKRAALQAWAERVDAILVASKAGGGAAEMTNGRQVANRLV